MVKQQYTINEHFTPVFLLEFFKDNDRNFYYLNKNWLNIGHCSPESACSKNDLHETKRDFGNGEEYVLRNCIENKLAERENCYSSLCKKIISICENPDNEFSLILNKEEKELLAEFVINLHLRHPNRLADYIKESYSELISVDGFFKEFEELKKEYPDEIITKILDGTIEQTLIKETVLSTEDGKGLLDTFKQRILSEGSFCIVKSAEDNFIISDNIAGVSKDGFMFIPISPRYAISISFDKRMKYDHKQNRLCNVKNDIVMEIANIIFKESIQYVYGRRETLEELKVIVKEERNHANHREEN